MTDLLSVYEAKARFSEVIRQVREGRTITISYRGEPVAEIRPTHESPSPSQREIEDLRSDGEYSVRSKGPRGELVPGKASPGALDRFLSERNE